MLLVMAHLKYNMERLPDEGDDVHLPCEVSFPHQHDFPDHEKYRYQLYTGDERN